MIKWRLYNLKICYFGWFTPEEKIMEIMENMNKCLNIQSYLKNSIFKKHPIILSPSKISKKTQKCKRENAYSFLWRN